MAGKGPLRELGSAEFRVTPALGGRVIICISPGEPSERHMVFQPDMALVLAQDIKNAVHDAKVILDTFGPDPMGAKTS